MDPIETMSPTQLEWFRRSLVEAIHSCKDIEISLGNLTDREACRYLVRVLAHYADEETPETNGASKPKPSNEGIESRWSVLSTNSLACMLRDRRVPKCEWID